MYKFVIILLLIVFITSNTFVTANKNKCQHIQTQYDCLEDCVCFWDLDNKSCDFTCSGNCLQNNSKACEGIRNQLFGFIMFASLFIFLFVFALIMFGIQKYYGIY